MKRFLVPLFIVLVCALGLISLSENSRQPNDSGTGAESVPAQRTNATSPGSKVGATAAPASGSAPWRIAPLPPGRSAAFALDGTAARAAAIPVAALDTSAAALLRELRVGDTLDLPLETATATALVRDVSEEDGTVRVAGELPEIPQASFILALAPDGGVFAQMLFPETGTALVAAPDPAAPGTSILERLPLSSVLCVNYGPHDPAHAHGEHGAGDGESYPEFDNNGPAAAGAVPLLSSRPEATAVLYLDFDGETVTDSNWTRFNNYQPIVAAASMLSTVNITKVWQRAAEDYAPFNVDVTTSVKRYNNAPVGKRMRCVITPTNKWYSGYGGVAYLTSFRNAGKGQFPANIVCWVFESALSNNEKNVAEAVSHELGHTFGLEHDGTSAKEYFDGHGTGANGRPKLWAPIMGVGYYASTVQWSRGEYQGANNSEDDLAIISSADNGVGYVNDTVGNTNADATAISAARPTLNGVILGQNDTDVYKFILKSASTVSISAGFPTNTIDPNLDLLLTLENGAGAVLQTDNPTNDLAASLNLPLTPGTYYVKIAGTGRGSPLTDGYSAYASAGRYTLAVSGIVSPNYPHDLAELPPLTNISEGAGVVLRASAAGTPEPTFQWQFSSDNGASWQDLADDAHHSGAASSTLTITNATPALDAFCYRYIATNMHGTATSGTAQIKLTHDAPHDLAELPALVNIPEGAGIILRASASGTPGPTFHWQLSIDNGASWQNLAADAHHSGPATSALTITNATLAMSAHRYRYIATNMHGAATSTVAKAHVFPDASTATNWMLDSTGDWHVATNWSRGLPGSATRANIPDGTAVVPGNITAQADEIFIESDTGAALRIANGGVLQTRDIHIGGTKNGSLENHGAMELGGNLYLGTSTGGTGTFVHTGSLTVGELRAHGRTLASTINNSGDISARTIWLPMTSSSFDGNTRYTGGGTSFAQAETLRIAYIKNTAAEIILEDDAQLRATFIDFGLAGNSGSITLNGSSHLGSASSFTATPGRPVSITINDNATFSAGILSCNSNLAINLNLASGRTAPPLFVNLARTSLDFKLNIDVSGFRSLSGTPRNVPILELGMSTAKAVPSFTFTGARAGTVSKLKWNAAGSILYAIFTPPLPADLSGQDLLEYALRDFDHDNDTYTGEANPAAWLPRITVSENGVAALTFTRQRADVTYTVEVSSDLENWTPVVTNPGTVGQTVTVEDLAGSGEPRRFMRLRLSTED